MDLSAISWDQILGGFALFMFGIHFMGDGLKSVAGDKLRDYIDKYTSNPIGGIFIGIIVTVLMQSSSATTAIVIGLVRAGLMRLDQTVGIILGANIGSTITSFLISVSVDKYAMYIVFVGSMLICFGNKAKTKYIGNVLLGFGLIFYGMSAMGNALAVLKDMPAFESFAVSMAKNPFLGLIAGVLLTAAIQSSAASIGVFQKLYQAGAVTFGACIPFMFGANIGTTMTGILASIGGSVSGKRTAAMHTIFNVLATILGMLFLTPYTNLISTVFGSLNPMMQLAVANICFNSFAVVIMLPFTKYLVKLVKKIVPGNEPEVMEVDVNELDTKVSNVLPSAAIAASQQSLLKMADVVKEDVRQTKLFLNDHGTEEDKEILDRNESLINKFDKKITDYLIQVSVAPNLTRQDTMDIRLSLETTKNFERIGDLATNLSEFYSMVYEDGQEFTEGALKDINAMYDQFTKMIDLAVDIFVTKDKVSYGRLLAMEDDMDNMEYVAREKHFQRMSNHTCTSPVAESVYCDVLGTLERMGDHCCNICRSSVTSSVDDLSEDENSLAD
jgi:phosphate:Na+ symporter